MAFHTYILLCADGKYYTGHTDHLERRIAAHNAGTFASFTENRRPLKLVWTQDFPSRQEALSAERQIKGWSRAKKEALIDKRWDELSRLSVGRSNFVLRQAQDERKKTGCEVQAVRGEPVEPRILVTPNVLTQLRTHSSRTSPQECCGIFTGSADRITAAIPADNVHPSPATHFEIDPRALIAAHKGAREGGPEVLGYYHSHPAGPARPSAEDRAQASGDGRIWAIIGADLDVTLWWDDEIGFTPLSYSVSGG